MFQSLGPAAANGRSLTVTSRDGWTTSSQDVDQVLLYTCICFQDIGQYFGLTTGGVLMGRQQRGSVDQTDIPRCSAVKCSVNNDCQFKLDSLRCSQPVKTGTTDRRRPATDRAAALRTDRRRLNGFLPRPASVELPLSSHSIRTRPASEIPMMELIVG